MDPSLPYPSFPSYQASSSSSLQPSTTTSILPYPTSTSSSSAASTFPPFQTQQPQPSHPIENDGLPSLPTASTSFLPAPIFPSPNSTNPPTRKRPKVTGPAPLPFTLPADFYPLPPSSTSPVLYPPVQPSSSGATTSQLYRQNPHGLAGPTGQGVGGPAGEWRNRPVPGLGASEEARRIAKLMQPQPQGGMNRGVGLGGHFGAMGMGLFQNQSQNGSAIKSESSNPTVIDLSADPSPSLPYKNSSAPIDLTSDDPPASSSAATNGHRPKAGADKDTIDRKPVCIGSLDAMALILYPSIWLAKGDNIPSLIASRDLRLDQPSSSSSASEPDEWLKVKLKYKKVFSQDKGKEEACINIMNAGQSVKIGVLNDALVTVLGGLMSRGLLRLEGWIKRGDLDKMFTAPISIILFTLPSNIQYISNYLADNAVFLDIPLPAYDPAYHSDQPVYDNPHKPPPGGFRLMRKSRGDALMGQGRPGMGMIQTKEKTVEVQREQVDQVFRSLKGGEELPITEPSKKIKTALFPHQKKALTFLLQREGEKSALENASQAMVEAAEKEIMDRPDSDLDADEDEVRKKKKESLKRRKKVIRKRGVNSLWEPTMDSDGDVTSWKNLVTEKEVSGSKKPKEARGAILADDMGLGKTLSIVSLIASTLKTARKYGTKPVSKPKSGGDSDSEPEDDESDGDDDVDEDEGGRRERDESGSLSPSHFAGQVFGMPEPKKEKDESGRGKKRGGKGTKKARQKKKEQELEAEARAARLSIRSRATLLVCPLSTVSNWEDQIREHWNGEVLVVGGMGISPSAAQLADAGDSVLKVYIYHGNSRKSDPAFVANFDIVITTFSVLQTEFSKQVKSVLPSTEPSSAAPSPPEEDQGSDADEVMEVDEDGMPAVRYNQNPAVELERAVMEKEEKMNSKKRKRGDCAVLFAPMTVGEQVSPLQAVEWFRVVLDEAHFIKDSTTVVSRAACYLEAERRIALTGTPIQNKIDDVWALLRFLRLAPFDDKHVWQSVILSLAKQGNSVGVARLQTVLKHCTLRRTKDTKFDNGKSILELPPRKDEIREIEFSEDERKIYMQYWTQSKSEVQDLLNQPEVKGGMVNVLHHILRLRQICDHWTLVDDSDGIETIEEEMLEDGLMDLETAMASIKIDGLTFKRAYSVVQCLKARDQLVCSGCDYTFEVPDLPKPGEDELAAGGDVKPKPKRGKQKASPFPIVARCGHVWCLLCLRQSTGQANWPKVSGNVNRMCGKCSAGLRMHLDVIEVGPAGQTLQTASTGGRNKTSRNLMKAGPVLMSAKMRSLLADLRKFSMANPNSDNYDPMSQEAELTDLDAEGNILTTKTVVFSQWTTMLDHIEDMLEESNIRYARLDGTMKREERADAMDRLKNDKKTEVLLVSLRAGGVGLNLTTATRCYLIDPYWNPSVENQAIDRIHRLGQTRNVTSVKFVVKDSIEERMLEVQKRKAELAKLSLSQTISKKDLHERRLEDLKLLFS